MDPDDKTFCLFKPNPAIVIPYFVCTTQCMYKHILLMYLVRNKCIVYNNLYSWSSRGQWCSGTPTVPYDVWATPFAAACRPYGIWLRCPRQSNVLNTEEVNTFKCYNFAYFHYKNKKNSFCATDHSRWICLEYPLHIFYHYIAGRGLVDKRAVLVIRFRVQILQMLLLVVLGRVSILKTHLCYIRKHCSVASIVWTFPTSQEKIK